MIASKIVTLDYGEGGLKTQEFIFQEILKRFNNPILAKLDDGSVIDIHHKKFVITTDSFIVDPPIFPGGNIGKLAVTGTVNDLVACGSKPIYLTLSLIIPEGFSCSRDGSRGECFRSGGSRPRNSAGDRPLFSGPGASRCRQRNCAD